ncbi:pyrophosphatase PpaX [Anaerosolibacter carboniphilus]|uniref:Pyrophosphatase PpaX n=1 Tax=Anaerosolibacter carboniphilus TaxID=1417629 RepID=A0A841L390_9FIRM|nr:pyrophosphatase PpaX [Anaerosolibacter carboniphilus]MBB6217612.1 pyrophosphatase PpaX [Anaerosolibacter carboniphilus]
MTIKYILFDLDGTLLDTNNLIIESFQHTYRQHLNKEVTREYILESFGEILRITLERECKDCVEEAIETYRRYQIENFDRLITIHTGVKEVVKSLYEQGYKLAVVTSRLNESALRGLKHFHLESYFECMIGADDTDRHKPDPTPARMALEAMGGTPEEAIMIGDSPFDIQCAQNAGIISAVVSWSALPPEIYMVHKPDYVIDSMEELVEIIEELNRK